VFVNKHVHSVTLDEGERECIEIPFKPLKPHTKYYVEIFLNGKKVYEQKLKLIVT